MVQKFIVMCCCWTVLVVTLINCKLAPDTACRLSHLEFTALNVIRVTLNNSFLTDTKPDSGEVSMNEKKVDEQLVRCRLRVTNGSCDTPPYMAERIVNTSTLIHSLWTDGRPGYNYTVCSSRRVVTSQATNDSDVGITSEKAIDNDIEEDNSTWSTMTITAEVRQPPIIDSYEVWMSNERLASTTRIGRRTVYVYRPSFNIRILATISASPSPNVCWYKAGSDESDCSVRNKFSTSPELSTTWTLLLQYANASDAGVYHIVAVNKLGRTSSSPINLGMAVMPPFEDDRTMKRTTVGYRTGCTLPASLPVPRVTWRRIGPPTGTENVILNDRIILGLDGLLSFVSMEPEDSGTYNCRLENTELHSAVVGCLTNISSTEESSSIKKPELLSTAEDTRYAMVGESVKLQCVFSGRPTPEILWYKGDNLLTNQSQVSWSTGNHTVEILNVTRKDAGNYFCKAMNSEGTESNVINVIVEESPRFTVRPQSSNVTVGDTVVFSCEWTGIPQPQGDWYINGMVVSDTSLDATSKEVSTDRTHLKIPNVSYNQISTIECKVTGDYDSITAAVYLNVFKKTKIIHLTHTVQVQDNNNIEVVALNCAAETDPSAELQISWRQNDVEMTNPIDPFNLVIRSNFTIGFTTLVTVRFTCRAFNGISTDSRFVDVKMRSTVSPDVAPSHNSIFKDEMIWMILAATVVIVIAIVIVTVFAIFYSRNRHKRSHLLNDGSMGTIMTHVVLEGSTLTRTRTSASSESLCRPDSGFSAGSSLALTDRLKATVQEMRIARERLHLGKVIGKGQFGRVYSAMLRDARGQLSEHVAVKTMKYKPDESEMVELFLKEAVLMKDFRHAHVLGVVGIAFDNDSSPMVILPYMSNGDLRQYILNPQLDITILELLKMGLQVANGMAYLSENRFVHRDLAARNCMVNERGICKVADFGLSRELLLRDYYRVENGTTPVPVRWMAPECLEVSVFTTMSDVWSYGVLLWELMTRGSVPYPEVENYQIKPHVQSGRRLDQPVFCPDVVFEIMKNCWEEEPPKRPTFNEIGADIERVIQTAVPGSRVSSTLYQNIHHGSNTNVDYRLATSNGADSGFEG